MADRLILLPIDGSVSSEAAARFAEDIARSEAARIMVLGVVVDLRGSDREAEVEGAVADFMREHVMQEVARIQEAGIQAEGLVTEAETPQAGILRVAGEQGARIIVMGTHGVTGWRHAVIGSVSDAVIRHAGVPVVLVPIRENR